MPWRICHATAFEPEAHLVKGFLEHQGIPCLLENRRPEIDSPRNHAANIRILVPEEWVPVASKLISHRTLRRRRPKGEVIAVDFKRRRRVPARRARGANRA